MLRFLIIFFISLAVYCPIATAESEFLSISDIHFNPLAGCTSSPCPLLTKLMETSPENWDPLFQQTHNQKTVTYYQDTSYALLQSVLSEAKMLSEQRKLQFVLVLGDFLDHELPVKFNQFNQHFSYETFVKKTMQFLSYKLRQTFPTIDIYPVVGNVDTYGKDYQTQGAFFKDMVDVWSPLITNEKNKKQFFATFSDHGYYAIDFSDTQKIIALNTILFSPHGQQSAVREAAKQQLIWLEKQLILAEKNHQTVLIICHIPPGINFNSLSTLANNMIKKFWLTKYTHVFSSLIKRFSDITMGVMAGHVHVDLIQLKMEGKNKTFIPIIFTPSVSPIFGNNPAIKLFEYEKNSFRLTKVERYYYADGWHKGNRLNAIPQSSCHYCYWMTVLRYLVVNNYLWDIFTKYYSMHTLSESDNNDWMTYYWCGLYSTDLKTYKNCISE